ncbi:hypothetical protein EYF80_004940 [Liparis tanakae]|uniref:Uncharacterized protein n=1 Tax=Liparis tanakae TaxID=230148 RepID=A0A4Z2J3H6_9TELE|nr:hypothetical protein EYF80_004940 [Liparis tanakae]
MTAAFLKMPRDGGSGLLMRLKDIPVPGWSDATTSPDVMCHPHMRICSYIQGRRARRRVAVAAAEQRNHKTQILQLDIKARQRHLKKPPSVYELCVVFGPRRGAESAPGFHMSMVMRESERRPRQTRPSRCTHWLETPEIDLPVKEGCENRADWKQKRACEDTFWGRCLKSDFVAWRPERHEDDSYT